MLSTSLPLGSLVAGTYRLESVLGQGGMGCVYRARHVAMDKPVALKLLKPESSADNEAAQRFVREARSVAKLQHPNVVHILDFGVHDGVAYMAMELLHGASLHDFLARDHVSALELLDLLIGAMRGVAAAHARGVIHRDIKPANIFIARLPASRGQIAKILDFGISKANDDPSDLTKTGSALGTPEYMSYEHMRDSKSVDARTDVYSFGVVLYQALTGISPFDAESFMGIALRVATHTPPSLRLLQPALPAELDRLVMQMIARDREQRPASLQAVCEVLTRLFSDAATQRQLARFSTPLGCSETPPTSDAYFTRFEDVTEIQHVTFEPFDDSELRPVHESLAADVHEPVGDSLRPPPALFSGAAESTHSAPLFSALGFAAVGLLGMWVLASGQMFGEPKASRAGTVVSATDQGDSLLAAPPPLRRSLVVTLHSTPPGAQVTLAGKTYGPTPVDIELDGDDWAPGTLASFRFQLPGYHASIVKRVLEGSKLVIEAPLQALPASSTRSPARARAAKAARK